MLLRAYSTAFLTNCLPSPLPLKLPSILSNNLIYPDGKDVKGKVYVQFVIGTDGVIEESSIRTLSKNELESMNAPTDDLIEDEAISLEAIRVIKLCPDWNPGLYNGVPSRQRMVVPLVFAP